MANIHVILPLMAIGVVIAASNHDKPRSDCPVESLNALGDPFLSGDYAGLKVTLDIASENDTNEYVVHKDGCGESGGHRRHIFTTHSGFVFNDVRDGDNVIWRSDYLHVQTPTLDMFEQKKYLTIVIYLSQKPLFFKYYAYDTDGWHEITRKDYITQTTDLMVQETLDVSERVPKGGVKELSCRVGCVKTKGFLPKCNHVLTKVTFGNRTLWQYDPSEPVECIRVDRISHKSTALVKLHLIEANGIYRTAILYGEGARTMSMQKYTGLMEEMNKLPVLEIPNRNLKFTILNQKKATDSNDDDTTEAKPDIIKVIDDEKVPEFLKEEVSVPEMWATDGECVRWDAFRSNMGGFVTVDIFSTLHNPMVTSNFAVDDNVGVQRMVVRPKETYLIGTIMDKANVVFQDPNLSPYTAVVESVENRKIMQLFTTTMDGKVVFKYFVRGSTRAWRETNRAEYVSLRTTKMVRRSLDLNDLNASRKYITIPGKRNISILTSIKLDDLGQLFPRFNVFIRQVLYKEEVVWEYKPKLLKTLVAIKRWKFHNDTMLSIDTVDAHDRPYQYLYRLTDDDRWKLVTRGMFVMTHKKPLKVDMAKNKIERMFIAAHEKLHKVDMDKSNIGGMRDLAGMSIRGPKKWDIEPVEGYYVSEVTYGTSVIWSEATSTCKCTRIYGIKTRGVMFVTLKLYDKLGDTHYVSYMKGESGTNFVKINIMLLNFIARNLEDKAFAKPLEENKFAPEESPNSGTNQSIDTDPTSVMAERIRRAVNMMITSGGIAH
ncbi:hypothetical protein X943_001007 [Babesia divergens]|uniref:Uncharacterized protein n=1 Tax=Babesia divergens TaxID=32595 RepID=A0AAD9LI43_BABDI|nr:hypothetical protein X943_001007 [Babesia divergens]